MKSPTPLLFAAVIWAVGSASHAAVLAEYKFDSGSAVANTVAPGVSAGSFQAISMTNDGSPDSDIGFSTGGTTFLRSDATAADQAGSLSDDDFFSVTITATVPGQTLNLTVLTLRLGGSSDASSAITFSNRVYLLSSVDNFGSVIPGTNDTAVINGSTTAAPFDMNVDLASFDLSGAAYQGLSSITFNLRLSDEVDLNGRINRLDDVSILGTVNAVPEPSSALLGGIGLVALLRRRR